MAPSSAFSTPKARWERKTTRFVSSAQMRSRVRSERAAMPLRFLNLPRSSRTSGWRASPPHQTRISAEALPPRTGRSCTSAVLTPARAAATAAATPGSPPPTTTKSKWCVSATGRASGESAPFGGGSSGAERTTPAQRPSKPVLSQSAISAVPAGSSTTPPSSHAHSRGPSPKIFARGRPFTETPKRPGAPSAQFLARTHTRHLPGAGSFTQALASMTRTPSPCARRYGEPITSMNCASSAQPPASKLCGGTSMRRGAASSHSAGLRRPSWSTSTLNVTILPAAVWMRT